jgi:hypothetical protein
LNSLDVKSQGAGTLRILAEDDSYVYGLPKPVLRLDGTVGGTLVAPAGSSATFESWVNPWNLVPAYGPPNPAEVPVPAIAVPPGSLAVWGGGGVIFAPGAFSSSSSILFPTQGPYSLFAQADLVFAGAGNVRSTVSFNENQNVVIPEPATIIVWSLLGGLAIAFGWRRCR